MASISIAVRHWRRTLGLVTAAACVSSTPAQVPGSAADGAPRLVVQAGPSSFIPHLVVSRDNRLLATAGDRTGAIHLWQIETGRLLCALKAEMPDVGARPGIALPAFDFSRDGTLLATADKGRRVRLWDLRQCRQRDTVELTGDADGRVMGLHTLPDGRALVLEGGRVHASDLFASKGALRALTPATLQIESLQGSSADGKVALARGRVGAGGDAFAPWALYAIDTATGAVEEVSALGGAQPVPNALARMMPPSAAVSPSGRWVAVHQAGHLRLFDRRQRTLAGSVAPPAAAPGPSSTPAPVSPQLKQMEDRIAGMLPMLPPEARAQVQRTLEQARELTADTKTAMAADPTATLPTWTGFSAQEDLLYVWRHPGHLAKRPMTEPDAVPKTVIEVRRLPDLALVREQVVADAPGRLLTLRHLASAFAASADRRLLLLGLPSVDRQVSLGAIDLTHPRPTLAAWKPSGGGAGAVRWSGDDRLVMVRSGVMDGPSASLALRGEADAQAALPRAPAFPGWAAPTPDSPSFRTTVVTWGLFSGDVGTKSAVSMLASAAAVSPDGGHVATLRFEMNQARAGEVRLHVDIMDTRDRSEARSIELSDRAGVVSSTQPNGIALSPDARRVAVLRPAKGESGARARDIVSLHDCATGRWISEHELPFEVRVQPGLGQRSLRFSRDGRELIAIGRREAVVLRGADGSQLAASNLATGMEVLDLLDGPPQRLAVRDGNDRGAVAGGLELLRLPRNQRWRLVQGDAQGGQLAAATDDGGVVLTQPGGASTLLREHDATVDSLSFSPNGRYLASSSSDGTTVIWDTRNRTWIAKLFSFSDGTWAVVDPQGRYDTQSLERLEFLHWVAPENPFQALPLEIFMRNFYEPRLLSRLFAGESMRPVPRLAELNHAQPVVRILSIVPSRADPARVDAVVEVEGRADSRGRASGAKDVRLFRDGRLVGYPERPGEALRLDPRTGKATLTFHGIRLAQRPGPVRFSAYAFNLTSVKSATAYADHVPAAAASASLKGRAYVVSIGVDTHDNPAFDLKYAVNDANAHVQALRSALERAGTYREVIGIPLLTGSGPAARNATKGKIQAVLSALAGRPADARQLDGVPGAQRIQAATPDDLVILTFSGHGHADPASGQFYLLPQDVGGTGREITPPMLSASIGTGELEAWLRDIDAGDLAMVIDACFSAASIQTDDFKPGPMGSRGVGQLAYDKGMRVLAAAQRSEQALELDSRRHGVLTSVLTLDGMRDGKADADPADRRIGLSEWLRFPIAQVPQLLRQQSRAATATAGTRAPRLVPAGGKDTPADAAEPGPRTVQTPRLFDYGGTAHDPVISVLP